MKELLCVCSNIYREVREIKVYEIISGIIIPIISIFVGAYITYAAVIKQIKEQRDLINQERKEQRELINREREESKKLAIRILIRFVWEEVDDNTNMLIRWNQSTTGPLWLNFDEYEGIKYELIKHKSESIEALFELYYLFRQFQKTHIGKLQVDIDREIYKIIEARDKIACNIHVDYN